MYCAVDGRACVVLCNCAERIDYTTLIMSQRQPGNIEKRKARTRGDTRYLERRIEDIQREGCTEGKQKIFRRVDGQHQKAQGEDGRECIVQYITLYNILLYYIYRESGRRAASGKAKPGENRRIL